MRSKRTLIVKEIRNLTDKEMYCYGTSGLMVKLRQFDLDELLRDENFRPEQEPNIYYVAYGDALERIKGNWKFNNRIAYPDFYGFGKGREELYRFRDRNEILLTPISDFVGEEGELKISS